MRQQLHRVRHTVTILVLLAGTFAAAAPKPNIVFFMVDDLGWNHISASQPTMGTGVTFYHTPNIERLADGGLSFTHCYSQPNCAPTRAALLSGQYPPRVHNSVYVVGNLNRNGRGGISRKAAQFTGPKQHEDVAADAITVAEALRQNGYATAHIGKYHVGGHEGGEATMPENAGFDINIGGCKDGHQRSCFASEKDGRWGFKGVGRGDLDLYAAPYTQAYLTRRSLPQGLDGSRKHIGDAMGDALETTIRAFAGDDKPFYIQFHTYAVHGPVRSRPDLKERAAERPTAEGHTKAEYAGFIASVDENVGRLMKALDDPNGDGDNADSILADTLVLFTSDNGGTHAHNQPLKGKKGMFTEGGIRVPLIACWKGVVPADTTTSRKIHSVDFYPTYLDLADARWHPPEADHPLDGESFAAVLRKPAEAPERGPVFYLFPGYMDTRAQPCAVAIDDIDGKRYKLWYTYETDSWELFCLSDDIGETDNLADRKPAVAAGLAAKLDAWLRQTHPTWQPRFPLAKDSGEPVGPPPPFALQ